MLIISILVLVAPPSKAGIYNDLDSLKEGMNKGLSLQSEIHTGILTATNAEGNFRHSFTSAMVIGLPEQKETRTILSCAHFALDQYEDKNIRFNFCDPQRKKYQIEKYVTLTPDYLNKDADIGLYFLKDPIPCNPMVVIERDFLKERQVFSVSHGIAMASDHISSVNNLLGYTPHVLDSTLSMGVDNVYYHQYNSSRLIHLSDGKNNRWSYMACLGIDETQPYYHDSGSSWFYKNQNNEYSLVATLSQEEEPSESLIAKFNDEKYVSEEVLLDETFPLRFVNLPAYPNHKFSTYFTGLAQHRDWIYANLK